MSVREEALKFVERAAARGHHGSVISQAELTAIGRDLNLTVPVWLSDLFTSVPLGGLEVGWRESPGPDGVVWLQWSDARNIRSESLECFPGCAIGPKGYINVASCSQGSGDPYFISVSAGEDPPLYRVYHDVSDQADLILDEGLHEVAPSLSSFFRGARVVDDGAA